LNSTASGLSHGTTYDLVEALYEIHVLGDDYPNLRIYSPDDVVD